MAGMSDFELVQVGLVAMALLHRRASPDEKGEEGEESTEPSS